MVLKVCKFGGTSLATREQIEKALDIMLTEKNDRRFMVVSAPGARFKGDTKVTDLLINAAKEYQQSGKSYSAQRVIARFGEIAPNESDLIFNLNKNLQARLEDTSVKNYEDSIKAFGEYASGVVINHIASKKGLISEFFDPLQIGFTIVGNGKNAMPNKNCYEKIYSSFMNSRFNLAVIPGFYGYNKNGELVTLPRGGSDTSGAVIARGVKADVYENWTDADGLKRADPRIVSNVETIPEMTYDEARELAYMGFKLQDACFEPIKGKNIVLTVRNTDNPTYPGTRIVDSREVNPDERVVGVACEKGFVSIGMRKMYVDKQVGFGRKMMSVLESMKLPYEHTLDGVDTTSLVLAKKYFKENTLELLTKRLEKACRPEQMMVSDMALVSVAGLGMRNHYDVHARTFSALASRRIGIKMIDEGADDLSFFIGVDQESANEAVDAIYNEFYPKK
jgi:aspartate kinase